MVFPLVIAALAGALAYIAFKGEHENWRRIAAVLAILLSTSYLLFFWRAFPPPQPGPHMRRALRSSC